MPEFVDAGDLVELELSAKFGENPLTTTGTWTDITGYLRRWSVRRGKSSPLGSFQPGRLTATLDNSDGRFDPAYTSGAYYPNVKPLVQLRLQARYNSGTWYPIWTGFAETFDPSFPKKTDQIVTLVGVDGFKILSMLSTTTQEDEEATDVRIGNLLDYALWPATWRNLSTGTVDVIFLQTECKTVTQAIRQIEAAEAGWFFFAADGNATLQARAHRSGLTVAATFGDSGSEIRYDDISMPTDDKEIRNSVAVSRIGGTTQTANNVSSQSEFGIRTLKQLDIPLTTDGAASTLATLLLGRYDTETQRISKIRVPALRDPSDLPTLLALDLSSKVTVVRRPSYATISQNLYVEGITHSGDAGRRKWSISYALSQTE